MIFFQQLLRALLLIIPACVLGIFAMLFLILVYGCLALIAFLFFGPSNWLVEWWGNENYLVYAYRAGVLCAWIGLIFREEAE